MLLRNVKVLDGRIQTAVTHQHLDRSHINSHLQQMRREAVPQGMNAMALSNARSFFEAIEDSTRDILRHVVESFFP